MADLGPVVPSISVVRSTTNTSPIILAYSILFLKDPENAASMQGFDPGHAFDVQTIEAFFFPYPTSFDTMSSSPELPAASFRAFASRDLTLGFCSRS